MTTRLDDPTATSDPVVRGIVVVTVVITVVGVLSLIRAGVGDSVGHVTVRVDNRAGLPVQVNVLNASGDRIGLGEANARTLATSRTATPAASSKVGTPLKVCTTVTANSPR